MGFRIAKPGEVRDWDIRSRHDFELVTVVQDDGAKSYVAAFFVGAKDTTTAEAFATAFIHAQALLRK